MKKLLTGTVMVLAGAAASCQQGAEFKGQYPETKKIEQTDTYFGTEVKDPYRWLEDDLAEDTKDWVTRQNKVTQAYLDKIPFRGAIKDRLTKLWNYEKYSAPFKRGEYTYFYKNDGLQNQYVLFRQKGDGDPEVFLDPNKFSKDGTTSLAGLSFTKDGSMCAYQISEGGSDWRKVIVLNAESREMLDDTLYDVKFSGISWKGNEGFYYSSYDKPKEGSQLSGKTQQHKLYYHKLGTAQSSDKVIFGEEIERRYVGGGVTEDGEFLVISAANATYGNELYIQSLNEEGSEIRPVVSGFTNEHDVVYSKYGKLFIVTNINAPNRKLVSVDAKAPRPSNWETVIPETEFPLSVSTCGDRFFVKYLRDAVSDVRQYDLWGQELKKIELPGLGTAGGFSGRIEDKELYYTFTSYIYPPTIFKYDIESGESTLYKKSGVDFNPDMYESKQLFITQADGTRIPMIITYKKGMVQNGQESAFTIWLWWLQCQLNAKL